MLVQLSLREHSVQRLLPEPIVQGLRLWISFLAVRLARVPEEAEAPLGGGGALQFAAEEAAEFLAAAVHLLEAVAVSQLDAFRLEVTRLLLAAMVAAKLAVGLVLQLVEELAVQLAVQRAHLVVRHVAELSEVWGQQQGVVRPRPRARACLAAVASSGPRG